jgi:uncharacterized membrane protein
VTVEPEVVDAPSRTDAVVRGASTVIGGPLGDHATRPRNRFAIAASVVIALTSFVLMLHWAQKSDCSDGNWVKLSEYRHACYTDVVALYFSEGLVNGQIPYVDHPVEYPVLTGAFMGLIGIPVHEFAKSHPGVNEYSLYYNLSALGLGLAAIISVIAMLKLRRRRPWDIAMFAISPALLLTATINWDLLAVAFAALAILAWSRERTALAGILIGLGAAAKLWPVFLLIPLVLLAWRSRKLSEAFFTAAMAVFGWLAVNLPVMLLYPHAWSRFFSLNVTREVDWGTIWYIGSNAPLPGNRAGLGIFHTLGDHITALNFLSYALFGLCVIGLAYLTYAAPRRPRLAQLAFLTVAAFLIISKVWSQQYVLWLLPLALLARPRWGAFLAWQFAEVCYFFAFDGELMRAENTPIFPEGVYIIASLLRLVTLVILCVLVIRDIMRPELDVVRHSYDDDPDGGVFVGSEDRWEVMAGHAPPPAPAAAR